ncbi:hypothetical protein [Mesorhizobium sp. KR1-2]|uniref:hypothetical protein n=1 Tax=Mesorhizobium sp. KR1-2 TaxID=3156609 RepID=UPI0032B5BE24
MGILTQLAQTVFNGWNANGTPRQIDPQEAVVWGTDIERAISAGLSNGGLIYDTKANMDADKAHPANSSAWVIGDSTVANNGIYRKTGASGSGSWVRIADLPYSFISASNTGAGTANAITATTSIPVPAADGGALIAVNIVAANTASPATVSFNGGAALTVKTSSGNNIVPGGLVAGMIVAGYVSGSTFRLLSDQVSAAIQAAAEAAAMRSESAANTAEAVVAAVDVVANNTAFAAALKKAGPIQLATTYTNVTVSAADVPALLGKLHQIKADALTTINLPVGAFTTMTGDIARIGAANANLRVVGADPVQLDMLSVASVTGSAGDWLVTYNVASSAGVSVGEVLKVFECGPVPLLAGDNVASYILRNRPLPNELCTPIVNTGRATITAGGDTITFTGGIDATANCLKIGDLFTIDGQTRQLTSVGDKTCSVASAWGDISRSGVIGCYVSRPNSGTITIVGTTVTGTGTKLLSEANVGDMVLVDGELIEITAISSDTAMTIAKSKTLAAGTPCSIITGGVLHDGAHVVTAVGAGTITVRNRGRMKPPVNRVTGGSFRVIKTVLKQTGSGDGLVFGQGASLSWLDRIALVGTRTGGQIGLLMNGRVPALPLAGDGVTSFGDFTQQGYTTACITGPDVAIADWYVNAAVGHGCTLNARMIALSGATGVGLWQLEGSFANVRRAVMSGNGSHGHFISTGANAKITEASYVANFGDGLRRQSGGSFYGECPVFYGNGSMNVRLYGTGGAEMAQSANLLSNNAGIYSDHAEALLRDGLIAAARTRGIDAIGSPSLVVNATWVSGNRTVGVYCDGGCVIAEDSAVVGNGGGGVYARARGRLEANGAQVKQNGAYQARADDGGRISLRGGSTTAVQVTGAESSIDITGLLGAAPTLTGVARLNEYTKDGAIIRDGAATAGFATPGLRVNGGDLLSLFKFISTAFSLPAVPAGGQVSFDMTVPGAKTIGTTAMINANNLVAGLQASANVAATDTVRVVVSNHTGSSISNGSATWTIIVLGAQ